MDMVRTLIATDPDRASAVLAGLAAYQGAERVDRGPAMPIVAQVQQASLHDYGGSGLPVVFVPSLINPAIILDIAPRNSMLRWLAQHGVRPLLVDWGPPRGGDAGMNIAAHVEQVLVPLIDSLGERPALAGYCLGGTIAMAAAVLQRPAGLALIAAPWRFSAFPDDGRAGLAALWQAARPGAEAMGCLPMEVLQTAFWRLDPERTLAKYADFGRLDPASDAARAFVAMEDWANGGAALTLAAGRDLFEGFFRDDLPGSGAWSVAGRTITPDALGCPVIDIVSTVDRIVPAAAAAGIGKQRAIDAGHVGMVVGRRAESMLWQPLLRWLSRLRHS